MNNPAQLRHPPGRGWAAIGVLLVLGAGLAGCAIPYPDVRQAAYGALGPDVIVMRPGARIPEPGTKKYETNDFPFVPGSVTKPIPARIDARDDATGRAAQWGITSAERCYPSGRIHRLRDTGPVGGTPDIVIDYLFDLSLWGIVEFVTRGEPRSDHGRAQRDFGLSRNDLKALRRVKIAIRNVHYYEATASQLLAARDAIYRNSGCRGRAGGKGAYQIVRIYAAEAYEVDVQVVDGASVDIPLLKAQILSAFTKRVRGTNLFFALEAQPVKTIGTP